METNKEKELKELLIEGQERINKLKELTEAVRPLVTVLEPLGNLEKELKNPSIERIDLLRHLVIVVGREVRRMESEATRIAIRAVRALIKAKSKIEDDKLKEIAKAICVEVETAKKAITDPDNLYHYGYERGWEAGYEFGSAQITKEESGTPAE